MLKDFHVFSPLDYEEVLFDLQSVYVWMCNSHAPERLDRFLFIFSIQEAIHPRSVADEFELQKIAALPNRQKKTK
jgi:hypothetical protein